jgi:mitogen-activated protein kinase kinase kinase
MATTQASPVQERLPLETIESMESSSGDDSNSPLDIVPRDDEQGHDEMQFSPATTIDNITPMNGLSTFSSWASSSQTPQGRRGSSLNTSTANTETGPDVPMSTLSRLHRPSAPARQPSHTYNPIRRPSQFINVQSGISHSSGTRSSSVTRSKKDADALYRAEEKAYMDRLRKDHVNPYFSSQQSPPSLGYSTETETDDESPITDMPVEDDSYDQDGMLYYGDDEGVPPPEEVALAPGNRERIEWHGMLQIVMKGDVVRQEKKRILGSSENREGAAFMDDVWIGLRAKVCGRTLAAQKRLLDEKRSRLDSMMDHITDFSIRGNQETGKQPAEQVDEVIDEIEKLELLFPNWKAFEQQKPRATSEAFRKSLDVVIAWHNATTLINGQFASLQKWVGNEELNFNKKTPSSPNGLGLTDESSFLDRLLKIDGLSALQGNDSMLENMSRTIDKAKETLIEYKEEFSKRHLPSYIEELQELINFPTRLLEQVVRLRLQYAKNMKDPTQLGYVNIDQTIAQFQILLKLAVKVKEKYLEVSAPSSGWDLPSCIDEHFDSVILEALRFYFKMLNWKLSGNKNTFKEAEILEQEWEFSKSIGGSFDGGDVEVAEQFSSLTSKLLTRLMTHFDKDLQRRPNESVSDMDKRYKAILDSVRVRQRMLFRFSRMLGQRFENATEYNLKIDPSHIRQLFDALVETNHFLINVESTGLVMVIASPMLWDRPKDIQSILRTCYEGETISEDDSCPYVLVFHTEEPVYWDGRTQNVELRDPILDVRPGRVRLVSNGSLSRLATARVTFGRLVQMNLDILIEQRANLSRVNAELMKIKKTTYKLSNAIMGSVDTIRKQVEGLDCEELIQRCFAFATEFGQRSLMYMDSNRRTMNSMRLTRLAIDWVSFVVDDCVPTNRQTFRWAVVALEFAMTMTQGQNILSISLDEWSRLQTKVGACMSLLISHFDIMGARSTLAAQAEARRLAALPGHGQVDASKFTDDVESAKYVKSRWLEQLLYIDDLRARKNAESQALGRVLEDSNEAERSLTYLSSTSTNVTFRWEQAQYIGGGTFGSVFAAINLDSGYVMAVKEIRLQDPQLIPSITRKIKDEMAVLEVLDHPNIVSYYGNEVHRDKVYIFMEYCSGGSLASLLEHGRIEDETVTMVYALQMLEGLLYLHESGIVHRDIKPENILLDHNGVIKYVDFGAAKLISKSGKTMIDAVLGSVAGSGSLSSVAGSAGAVETEPDPLAYSNPAAAAAKANKSMIGTPMYMSREVVTGLQTTAATQYAVDIWAVGCVVLEMATGRKPWSNLDNEWAILWNIANGNTPQLPNKDQLSEAGIDFLRKCFEVDPLKRPSAAELLRGEWMRQIKSEVSIEPDTPTGSETSSNASGGQVAASSVGYANLSESRLSSV